MNVGVTFACWHACICAARLAPSIMLHHGYGPGAVVNDSLVQVWLSGVSQLVLYRESAEILDPCCHQRFKKQRTQPCRNMPRASSVILCNT